jgi:hypothetical protein
MKKTILLFLASISIASAQTNEFPPTFVKGSMDIHFATKTDRNGDVPREGVMDRYNLSLNVCDSVLFKGQITVLPYIPGVISPQQGSVNFDVGCDVINPKNTSQTRNVGKMFGNVPVDQNNVYHFETGTARISVFSVGVAKGFESKFSGSTFGKPPQTKGLVARVQEAMSVSKTVNGKAVTLSVSKYDKMEFKNHVLAAGPVAIYPEVTLNGLVVYDYARSAWYFKNVTAEYAVDGRKYSDRLTGNIRWTEAPDRKTSGLGQYDFDIRVNEPPANEAAAFQNTQDESAFFQTDNSMSSLSGTMKYKDTLSGDDTTASAVQIDLTGNRLTKQQAMYLCKMLVASMIVPLNSD